MRDVNLHTSVRTVFDFAQTDISQCLPSPNPLHILEKRNQLLKRKVSIAKLRRGALFFEGDDVAGEDRPEFVAPAFGAAAAQELAYLAAIGQQHRIRAFDRVCFGVHFVGVRSVGQTVHLRFP